MKIKYANKIYEVVNIIKSDGRLRYVVEDELPKLNSGMVIVASYKGEIDFMKYSNSGWHNSKRWCCVKGVITHWMPLPQPPTVAENATVKEKGDKK